MAIVDCPSFRVILCGDYGVGKTTIFKRFCSYNLEKKLDKDHYERKFGISKTEDVKLQLWDTAGLERVAILPNSYYKYADAAILVYAINDIESFNSLAQVIGIYILDVVNNSDNSKFYLCGNKIDLKDIENTMSTEFVDKERVNAFRLECASLISKEFEITANDLNSNGISKMFEQIAIELNKSYRSKQHIYYDPSILKLKNDPDSGHIQSNGYCQYC